MLSAFFTSIILGGIGIATTIAGGIASVTGSIVKGVQAKQEADRKAAQLEREATTIKADETQQLTEQRNVAQGTLTARTGLTSASGGFSTIEQQYEEGQELIYSKYLGAKQQATAIEAQGREQLGAGIGGAVVEGIGTVGKVAGQFMALPEGWNNIQKPEGTYFNESATSQIKQVEDQFRTKQSSPFVNYDVFGGLNWTSGKGGF